MIVYALLLILALFYTMFLMMANILNKNQKLQQENLFLSVQQERYENLRSAIEEARQARHDIRHHFLQLSAMAKDGDLEKIKEYLQNAMDKIPTLDYHFCENQSVDNVIGYYYALAQKEEIPFDARVDLPKELSVDEMDLCLILSNLLENALEASRKTTAAQQQISFVVQALELMHLHSVFIRQVHRSIWNLQETVSWLTSLQQGQLSRLLSADRASVPETHLQIMRSVSVIQRETSRTEREVSCRADRSLPSH